MLKGIIAHITSISFATRLQGIQSRRGTRAALNKLSPALNQYQNIKISSQMVRNDLTTEQQYRLTNRVVATRKHHEMKVIASGRGRKLKTHSFPELASVMQYAFGEKGPGEDSGMGGLECHPRLTTDTMYRGNCNMTTMKQARELLLSLSPEGFTISLSTCYNYTENYRKGSYQALRHHAGRGVNSNVSLKMPSRTGVDHLVVNLHWSSCNVNYIVDNTDGLSTLVVSKDSKAIVPADIPPVQCSGRTWQKRIDPDHTWDQSRNNSITPMTFLFLQCKATPCTTNISEMTLPLGNVAMVQLTRTGQPVTFLYLSFYEPETTFKCLNELLFMLTLSGLDAFFRSSATGNLKKEFVFIVDNGPSEQPSCPMVQMCLARLLLFLKLEKITQCSFAEYHSKRNYVERTHAEENRVLSKHGPFSSTKVHQTARVGTPNHRENMEAMALEVKECISTATFGGNSFQCYRGIKPIEYIFKDEETLHTFLSLTEEMKQNFSDDNYGTSNNRELLDVLTCAWGIDTEYCGSYRHDYSIIYNDASRRRTCWKDKYTTVIYSDLYAKAHYEIQPLPDYIRWSKSSELHYLPLNERKHLENGPWDDIPGLLLPSRILQLCTQVISDPPEAILEQISLLAWIPTSLCKQFYEKQKKHIEDMIANDCNREAWNAHPLMRSYKKQELESMCRRKRIPISSSLNKFELVRLLSEHSKETPIPTPPLYSGSLASVPDTTTSIARLSVGKLRAILHWHHISPLGTKEELVLRVFLLRQQKTAVMFNQQEEDIRNTIDIVDKVIKAERVMNMSLTSHVYHKRRYSTSTANDNLLIVPESLIVHNNWIDLFNPLREYMQLLSQKRKESDESTLIACRSSTYQVNKEQEEVEQMKEVGARVKVKWNKEEVGDSGWRPGWYAAVVQAYIEDSDTLVIVYPSEPNCTYSIELHKYLSEKSIKLIKPVI